MRPSSSSLSLLCLLGCVRGVKYSGVGGDRAEAGCAGGGEGCAAVAAGLAAGGGTGSGGGCVPSCERGEVGRCSGAHATDDGALWGGGGGPLVGAADAADVEPGPHRAHTVLQELVQVRYRVR